MPALPEWWDWIALAIALTTIYFYQRSRWGIRLMSRQSMRAQMEKEINDVLWVRCMEGSISLKDYIYASNLLGIIFDFPDLRTPRNNKFKELRAAIKRRLRKKTPKPNIPGEKPIQEPRKTAIRTKTTSLKFTAA